MYFKKFPFSFYDIDSFQSILVTDFLRAIRLDPVLTTESMYYTVYTAKDNETPEIISHKFYGSSQYHWVIMLLNQKFNPYDDFPKSEDIVRKNAERIYGDINAVHHYENMDGEWVDEFTIEKNPVTNYEYMIAENEKKRQVKILNKEVLAEFVQTFEGLIVNG